MRTRFTLLSCTIIAALLLSSAMPAHCQDLNQLHARFRARYTQLLQLKRGSKIGETFQGYAEAVNAAHFGDQNLNPLVMEENADRRALYAVLARQQNATPPPASSQRCAGYWLAVTIKMWSGSEDQNEQEAKP
jgi:uncharacterized protein YdbL (DUF1318 family)